MTQTNISAPNEESPSRHDYQDKDDGYFGGVRRDFLELLPQDGSANVLEIGCGSGETGAAAIREGRCATYAGIELAPQAAKVARSRLTEVFEGNVEHMDWPWPNAHFDAVLMSEVLEHLIDPWSVVKRVATVLKPNAAVLASSPNVSQMSVVKGLLADRWELTDTGVMDRTHLRWFTQSTYVRMFEQANILVDSVGPMAAPGPGSKLFNAITFGRFRHLTMRQICIVGRKG